LTERDLCVVALALFERDRLSALAWDFVFREDRDFADLLERDEDDFRPRDRCC
jgi:hypothetical protein